MRNIVRNLLLLIAVCTVFLLFTRPAESFAAKKPAAKKPAAKKAVPKQSADKYIQYLKGVNSHNDTCLSFGDKKVDLAYVNSKYATKNERKAKNINRGIQSTIMGDKSDYYCVSSTPIKYKKGDKTTRDKLLNEYGTGNNMCNTSSMQNATSVIISQELTTCPKFYNVNLTKDEKKRGIVAEIPCLKCVYNN